MPLKIPLSIFIADVWKRASMARRWRTVRGMTFSTMKCTCAEDSWNDVMRATVLMITGMVQMRTDR